LLALLMPLEAGSRYEARRACTETLRRPACADELAHCRCLPISPGFRSSMS